MAGEPSPYVSIKLHDIGRPQTVLLDDLRFDPPLAAGESVVVQTDTGPSVGTIVRMSPSVAERRQPAAGTPMKVLRRTTQEDVLTRLKQKQREQEAYRVALL